MEATLHRVSKLDLVTRIATLEEALLNLVATIDLHTDCMTGLLERSALDQYVDVAEQLLGVGWEVDPDHPANKVTSVPAAISYPTGSLGESTEA
jgi:hypothetical protein